MLLALEEKEAQEIKEVEKKYARQLDEVFAEFDSREQQEIAKVELRCNQQKAALLAEINLRMQLA